MDAGKLVLARQTLDRARPADRQSYWTLAEEALLLALEGRREQASKRMDNGVLKYLGLNPLATLTGAEFYAVMGNRQQALEWLERTVHNGDERAEWFARDPTLASIRSDPRLRQIINSIAIRRAHRGAQHLVE